MKQFFLIGQIITGLLLIGLTLLQGKGGGLGTAFGKTSRIYQAKRGVEKIVFTLTIIVAGLFLLLSIANVI